MGITDTSIAAASAALSGVAAFAAWRASKEANHTASSVAQIERDRWHNDLTPRLRLWMGSENQQRGSHMYIRFEGPASRGRLQVRFVVRDDRDHSQDVELAGGPTAETRAQVIWGPYRFRPGIDRADQLGRTSGTILLEATDHTRLAVDPSVRPDWYEGQDGEVRWRRDYGSLPMRLWVECEAPGHRPWRLPADVPDSGDHVITGPAISGP
jgi:hypothetical protein